MYRVSGAIPTIEAERIPRRILVFDTEAYRSAPVDGVEYQTLRMGVCHYITLGRDRAIMDQEWFTFTTGQALAAYVDRQSRKDLTLYIYAHNIKYDLQLSGLYTLLIDMGYIPSLFVMEDPPTFIRLRKGRHSLVMVDTFNYWQYSLSEMGRQLGTLKLDMPSQDATLEAWETYCKRDVEVLSEYILTFIRFLADNDLSGMALTLAGQAFRSYRHRFMSSPIILHNRPQVLELERAAYYGGRTETFFIGQAPEQDYYKLDVNSMYPYVMKNELYPVEMEGYSEDIPVKRLAELCKLYYCIAEVSLNTQAAAYAMVRGPKLIFPVGQFRANLHQVDIARALSRDEIIQVHKIAIYRSADIFSAYVDYFYTLKLEAERADNPVMRKMAKIFMNSLYGKFGQREIISKIIPLDNPQGYKRLSGYSESLGQSVEVNYLGNALEVRYKGGESAYSFPAIAGAVTAYARAHLWYLIERAGLENVFYMDTDSLIVNPMGFNRLGPHIDQEKLGALKLEGIERNFYIHTIKDYQYGPEIKVKGVPHSARPLGVDQWEYEQFRGAKTWIKEGMESGVKVYTRVKHRKTPYDKGLILPSGQVIPLRLGG